MESVNDLFQLFRDDDLLIPLSRLLGVQETEDETRVRLLEFVDILNDPVDPYKPTDDDLSAFPKYNGRYAEVYDTIFKLVLLPAGLV